MINYTEIRADEKLLDYLKYKRLKTIQNIEIIVEEDILSKLFSEERYKVSIDSVDRKRKSLFIECTNIPIMCLMDTVKATFHKTSNKIFIGIEYKTYDELIDDFKADKIYTMEHPKYANSNLDHLSKNKICKIPLYGVYEWNDICPKTSFTLINESNGEGFYHSVLTDAYDNLIKNLTPEEVDSIINGDMALVRTQSLFNTNSFWK